MKKEAILQNIDILAERSVHYMTCSKQEFVCVAMAIPVRGKSKSFIAFSRVNAHFGSLCSKTSSTHAEENLVKMLDPNIKYDILVMRVSRCGNITCARPCVRCINYHLARCSNIRYVHYSDFEGRVRSEHYDDLINSDYKYKTRRS